VRCNPSSQNDGRGALKESSCKKADCEKNSCGLHRRGMAEGALLFTVSA